MARIFTPDFHPGFSPQFRSLLCAVIGRWIGNFHNSARSIWETAVAQHPKHAYAQLREGVCGVPGAARA